jgi:hypothetical protein
VGCHLGQPGKDQDRQAQPGDRLEVAGERVEETGAGLRLEGACRCREQNGLKEQAADPGTVAAMCNQ